MKLVLQIAGGVILGVAVLLLVRAIPGWIAESRESDARSISFNLTPDTVIAKCGQPVADTSIPLTDDSVVRTLSYSGLYSQSVLVKFIVVKNAAMNGPLIDTESGDLKNESAKTQLATLPCLAR